MRLTSITLLVLALALALGQASAQPAPATVLATDQEQTLKPKDIFKDCPDCPEMVVIPAGKFLMGSKEQNPGDEGNEGPQHEVIIAKPFAVGRFSVTFEEWDKCVAAGGCVYNPSVPYTISRRPAEVTWPDAQKYVTWLSSITGKPYRLLSEAEREYVTRAGTTTVYNTGDTIAHDRAWYSYFYYDAKQSKPVGSFPPNAFGVYDTHGNMDEWVEDCWHSRYDGAPADGSAWIENGDCELRVLRGGGWRDSLIGITSANRRYAFGTAGVLKGASFRGPLAYAGFRVARAVIDPKVAELLGGRDGNGYGSNPAIAAMLTASRTSGNAWNSFLASLKGEEDLARLRKFLLLARRTAASGKSVFTGSSEADAGLNALLKLGHELFGDRFPAPAAVLAPGEEAALKPKDVFKDCRDCPDMVAITAGTFLMGSKEQKPGDEGNEGPQHEVIIAKPFAVGRFSVTFEEWHKCVAAGGCNYNPSEISRRPVVVIWLEAKNYVAWLSKLTGKPYRLLSEAEREYVTRAGTTTVYNTGDIITDNQAWFSDFYYDAKQSKPVGSFPPNAFGVYDTHGNMDEWVEDCWHGRYDGAPADGSAWIENGDCDWRVLRGGGWGESLKELHRQLEGMGKPPRDPRERRLPRRPRAGAASCVTSAPCGPRSQGF